MLLIFVLWLSFACNLYLWLRLYTKTTFVGSVASLQEFHPLRNITIHKETLLLVCVLVCVCVGMCMFIEWCESEDLIINHHPPFVPSWYHTSSRVIGCLSVFACHRSSQHISNTFSTVCQRVNVQSSPNKC